MVFGLSSSESRQRGTHQRSSAIGPEFSIKTEILKPRNHESGKQEMLLRRRRFGVRWLDTVLDRRATVPVFLTQNGGGTLTRKIAIIARPMTSLPSIAPMFPSKLPQPARPASIIRLPA